MRAQLALGVGMILLLTPEIGYPFDADDFTELVGYTIIAVSNVRGDFEGADFDKPVGLDNGMIFEFTTYSYTYAYRPTAVVFARRIGPEELQGQGGPKAPGRAVTFYKLLVEDEIYDVRRVR